MGQGPQLVGLLCSTVITSDGGDVLFPNFNTVLKATLKTLQRDKIDMRPTYYLTLYSGTELLGDVPILTVFLLLFVCLLFFALLFNEHFLFCAGIPWSRV